MAFSCLQDVARRRPEIGSQLTPLLTPEKVGMISFEDLCGATVPAKPSKDEQIFISLFVSAYENFAWAGSRIDRLDEQFDGAVEALVTRADGRTMAN